MYLTDIPSSAETKYLILIIKAVRVLYFTNKFNAVE